MLQNIFFYILKFNFDISISKRSKNTKKNNLMQKNSKFKKKTGQPQFQTGSE
jgi:hypothetical protein